MKKLFVTVGSTKFPELIEAIISKDFISLLLDLKFSHLVVQSGSTPVPPMSLQDLEVTCYSYKPSIIDDMKDAYMIISHAGSGSILEALSMDKKLLVVINESLMDNHQVDLANELSPDYLIASTRGGQPQTIHLLPLLKRNSGYDVILIMEEFKRESLFNKLEYVALFKLNRPVQTIQESVHEYKSAQQSFKELVQLVKESNNQRELKWAKQLADTIRSNQEKIAQDEVKNKLEQRQMVDRARRANRTMLADAISVVNKEYAKMKENELKDMKDDHDMALNQANEKIKGVRLDIIRKKDGITKLNGQIRKMQVILRRNNLVSENADSQNKTGNTKTMIESLQRKLEQKEETIKSLMADITRLQSTPQNDRRRTLGNSLDIEEDAVPLEEESSFDLSAILPDFIVRVPNNHLDGLTPSRGASFSQSKPGSFRRGSSFLGPRESNANRRGSVLKEKRASISLKGFPSSKKESIQGLPLPVIEIKQTVEERLLEITEKYENIISEEQSRHNAEVNEIMELITENDAIGFLCFKNDMSFSNKRFSENRTFQKNSLELLNSIQGLFPIRIHPSKVSSYTQCELDDIM